MALLAQKAPGARHWPGEDPCQPLCTCPQSRVWSWESATLYRTVGTPGLCPAFLAQGLMHGSNQLTRLGFGGDLATHSGRPPAEHELELRLGVLGPSAHPHQVG